VLDPNLLWLNMQLNPALHELNLTVFILSILCMYEHVASRMSRKADVCKTNLINGNYFKAVVELKLTVKIKGKLINATIPYNSLNIKLPEILN